jgi:hypothetical protein
MSIQCIEKNYPGTNLFGSGSSGLGLKKQKVAQGAKFNQSVEYATHISLGQL